VRELEEEMGIKNAVLEELFDFWYSNDVCRLWGRLFRRVTWSLTGEQALVQVSFMKDEHNHPTFGVGNSTSVQHDVHVGAWCRCQYDGPFVLDPEEVESGSFMSLQVLCQRRALPTAP
jgi:hypothetical protein